MSNPKDARRELASTYFVQGKENRDELARLQALDPMTPEAFLHEYERRTNTHRFEEVAPLIADTAVYWFNDGSFQGIDAIKQAFERTWAFIQDEDYAIENIQWLVEDQQSAVCVYLFRWQGKVEGRLTQGIGRGTSVLKKVDSQWKVIHEHLSSLPR